MSNIESAEGNAANGILVSINGTLSYGQHIPGAINIAATAISCASCQSTLQSVAVLHPTYRLVYKPLQSQI